MSRGAIVITGASTGIGEACALRLAEVGFDVFAGVRKEADGEKLKAQAADGLTPIQLDVTDPETIEAAVERVTAAVGERGLAGLFNNAGISGGGPLEFIGLDDIRAMFEVNVFGLIATTQAFLPLIRKGRGRVVCTGSISGRLAAPFVAPYSASKAAVQALCHCLRVELRPWGIKVICVEPGSIATPIWEKAQTTAAERIQRMGPAMFELYGPTLTPFIEASRRSAARGIPPSNVADVVEKAFTATNPRPRYLVGSDARALAVVGRLPDRARDAVIARGMGLPKPS